MTDHIPLITIRPADAADGLRSNSCTGNPYAASP
jgi:hypothetical protein